MLHRSVEFITSNNVLIIPSNCQALFLSAGWVGLVHEIVSEMKMIDQLGVYCIVQPCDLSSLT